MQSTKLNTLQSLKVSELKARCKELGIPNYSKLSKALLIAKIIQHLQPAVSAPIPTAKEIISQNTGSTQQVEQISKPKEGIKEASKGGDKAASDPQVQVQVHVQPSPINRPAPPTSQIALTAPNIPKSIASTSKSVTLTIPRHSPTVREAQHTTAGSKVHRNQTKRISGSQKSLKRVFLAPKSVTRPKLIPKPQRVSEISSQIVSLEDLASRSDREQHAKQTFLQVIAENLDTGPNRSDVFSGIDAKLYDDASSFAVAIRFSMFRLYHCLQLGSGEVWSIYASPRGLLGPDINSWPAVRDVRQVIPGISRVITTANESFLVLSVTGEVIGREGDEGTGIRDDWMEYIRTGGADGELCDLVQTKNLFDYPGGVSKAVGLGHLRDIASRAVLSSCAAESFSGPKLDLAQMDSEALGRPTSLGVIRSHRIQLYLPEPNQVVSVHVPHDSHNALAIVHRLSGTTEYILRETGQVVGEEDSGVMELWQGILGCDANGKVMDRSDFWSGWGGIMEI